MIKQELETKSKIDLEKFQDLKHPETDDAPSKESVSFKDIYNEIEDFTKKPTHIAGLVLPKPIELALCESGEVVLEKIEPTVSISILEQACELIEAHASLLIHQYHNGIQTTSLTVASSNPLLDGAVIELMHYDTANGQFHIQLNVTQACETQLLNNQPQLSKLFHSLNHVHVNRLEINGRSILEKKERQSPYFIKEVVKTK